MPYDIKSPLRLPLRLRRLPLLRCHLIIYSASTTCNISRIPDEESLARKSNSHDSKTTTNYDSASLMNDETTYKKHWFRSTGYSSKTDTFLSTKWQPGSVVMIALRYARHRIQLLDEVSPKAAGIMAFYSSRDKGDGLLHNCPKGEPDIFEPKWPLSLSQRHW
jgi:hypothetical protein